jgi:hypothetical protein
MFIETPRFPDEVSAWAVGGRAFQTIATENYGGYEYRNAAWAQARGMWDVRSSCCAIFTASRWGA